MQRVVQLASEHVGGELGIGRGKQVGPTYIADEERVAGEHRVWRRVVGVLVDQDADRLGSVTRRRDDLEGDASEREPLPVVESVDRKPDLGSIAVADDGTGASGKLEMATQEVGVDVRLDDSLDGESELVGLREVVADIPAGIDDHRPAGRLVTDEVRRVGQTPEVVLGEDHHCQASRHLVPRWWETGRKCVIEVTSASPIDAARWGP